MASRNINSRKYAVLSTIDPGFAQMQKVVDDSQTQLWALPLDQIRALLKEPAPQFLPEDIPQDLDIHDSEVAVRDGTKIGIRVYKAKDVRPHAPLLFSMHGGGWVIGSHVNFAQISIILGTTDGL